MSTRDGAGSPRNIWVYVTANVLLGGGDQILMNHARALQNSPHRIVLFSMEMILGRPSCADDLRALGVEIQDDQGGSRLIHFITLVASPLLLLLAAAFYAKRKMAAARQGKSTEPMASLANTRMAVANLLHQKLTLRRLKRYLAREEVAGIHVFHAGACLASWPIVSGSGARKVYTEITSPRSYGHTVPDISRLIPEFDEIVVPALMIGSQLAEASRCRKTPRVIPFTVKLGDPPPESVAYRPARFHFGSVGRLSEEKAQRFLVQATPHILKRCPEARLVLAGDGPSRQNLEAMARELGVSDHIDFLGAFRSAQLAQIMEKIDILVLPSIVEGMPHVLIEAMAFGKPIIASPVGAVPEMVEDGANGLLCPVGDVEGLAERILRLLLDAPLREKMGRTGNAFYRQRYDLSVVLQRIRTLCDGGEAAKT